MQIETSAHTPLPAPLQRAVDELTRVLVRISLEHAPATLASSLSAEDMVLTDIILRRKLDIEIFTLDTGRLHADTLALIGAIGDRYGHEVRVFGPDSAAVAAYVEEVGRDALYESVSLRKRCCEIRKVEPLGRALAGKQAWLTGQRRAQAVSRAQLQLQEFDTAHGLAKFNPLADWSEADVWQYIRALNVPYNRLHDQGYRSIGCAPCTRPTVTGEDVRAGRWWWELPQARECGLHAGRDGRLARRAGVNGMSAVGAAVNPARAVAPGRPAGAPRSHLDWLEAEAIFILREVAAECEQPVLFFSGGKDSIVLLRLAEHAFRPGRFPFPLLHIDTGHNFAEVIDFRDRRAAELGERLIVRSVEESMRRGTVRLRAAGDSRNAAQSVTLLEAISEFTFDAAIGGARRDEEKARAKERVFSFRDEWGQWDPKNQRPELWNLYNARVNRGEHMRVFPISNWTEMDVWEYIGRERLEVPSIYFAHRREVVRRDGMLMPVTPLTPPAPGEQVENISVRFRTVGDITCTSPVESSAANVAQIIAETAGTSTTERGATRRDDQTSDASMERRKKEGYF